MPVRFCPPDSFDDQYQAIEIHASRYCGFPGARKWQSSSRASFDAKAGPIQKFVKAVGDSLTLRATAIVVEEDNGGILCPLVGSGDPIPRAAARGCETKSGT